MNRNYPVTLTLSLCLMLAAFAIPATAADLANLQPGPSALQWQPTAGAAGWVLTVSGPDGFYLREQFDSAPALGLFDSEGQFLADGLYTYELQALPQISAQLRQDLDAAANDLVWREYLAARMDSSDLVQSGNFRIYQGALVQGDQEELSAPDLGSAVPTGDFAVGQAVPEGGLDHTQVINMDLLVDGSLCVGFDCGSSQNFGFDTVRLRENNLRIHFDDTSNSGSFPSNDWRLVANDTGNGGANRFSIEDSTAGRDPFTIEAGSIANALYVDSAGDVGIGTNMPVVELHAVDGNTPTLRLDQNGSNGFNPQIWDLAGNEANFFIRDVTNGSRLPFRIKPGAPTNAISIAADGDIGIGTENPGVLADGSEAALHVTRSDGDAVIFVQETSATEENRILMDLTNNGQVRYVLRDTSADGEDWEISNLDTGFNISRIGSGGPEVVITDRDPSGATNTMTVDGDIAAVNFNATSSRTLKTGLQGLNTRQVLSRLMNLDLYEWSFTADPSGIRHLGPMAEDFHDLFPLSPDNKKISLVDSNGVALAAIQGLHGVVMEKDQKIADLTETLANTQRQLDELKSLVESLVKGAQE